MRFFKGQFNYCPVFGCFLPFFELNNKSIETMNVAYELFIMINVQVLTNF